MSTTAIAVRSIPVDDHDLRRRIAAGDATAIADCYRSHAPLVRSYIARFVPHHEVDDVLQAVFFELWRSAHRYDAGRSLRGWLFGIARKRAIDQLRNNRAKGPVAIPFSIAGDVPGSDGRVLADRHALSEVVSDALGQLPSTQAAVLRLAYFDGYTQVDIAAMLGVPLGTVKTRSTRGLRALALLLVSTE